ncbi:MAG: hypothetical protein ACRCYB_07290, partial [Aeromonas veronii]
MGGKTLCHHIATIASGGSHWPPDPPLRSATSCLLVEQIVLPFNGLAGAVCFIAVLAPLMQIS